MASSFPGYFPLTASRPQVRFGAQNDNQHLLPTFIIQQACQGHPFYKGFGELYQTLACFPNARIAVDREGLNLRPAVTTLRGLRNTRPAPGKPNALVFERKAHIDDVMSLALKLSQEFANTDDYTYIDLNTFNTPESLTKLVGPKPGRDKEGELVKHVLDRPNGVIILDNFEQAHPEVQRRLLCILRYGEIRTEDSQRVPCPDITLLIKPEYQAPEDIL